jgi:hypothetical protein
MPTLTRDQHFADQVREFDFRYRCLDCNFVNRTDLSCSMAYPNQMLLDPQVRPMEREGVYVFCKYFELEELA